MRLQKNDHGLFFILPVDVAESIGLAEGGNVTVRATSDRRMGLVRMLEDATQEVVASFDIRRRA